MDIEDAKQTDESSTSEQGSSVDAGSQPAGEQQEQGSKAESPTAAADETPSMGDAIKAEMSRINDASQDRLEGQTTQDDEAGESPTPGESGKESESTKEGDGDRTGEGEGADEQKAAADEADWLKKQKPETAKRFQELTGKLKSTTEETASLKAEMEPLKEQAQRMDRFNHWVNETAGFESQEQWQQFLQMGVLLNRKPAVALQRLEQYATQLRERLGLAGDLPQDIQKRLDDGLIDEGSARELAQQRRLREIDTETTQQERERDQQRKQRESHEKFVRDIGDAVNDAEKAWMAKDPDYKALAPYVQDRVVRLLQEKGRDLKTKDDAVALFEGAVAEVKKGFRDANPQQRRQIQQPGTSGAGGGNQTAAGSQPKSLIGAMRKAYREGKEA